LSDAAGTAVRLLLVDDSALSRAQVQAALADAPGVEIVGQAVDGEGGLKAVDRLAPDLVVLDLQMPRMDGFTFLRLLMARRPTPVVVVSSQSHRSDVFRAMELGALDFVAKPDGRRGAREAFRAELLRKCATVRAVKLENLASPRRGPAAAPVLVPRVVAVGASTGGPQAVQQLLAALPGRTPLAVLLAQHMPEKFTASFAERLSHGAAFAAREAAEGDLVAAGRVLVAPGGHHLLVVRDEEGSLRARVERAAGATTGYTPSVDRLFTSAAEACGPRACGVVLTGMGNDGQAGIRALRRAGGLTIAESAATAVVYGMPQAAVETGAVDEVLALGEIAGRLVRFSEEC
jgi:two-component system, chemotaxis family, protein-glutamate methylesterase/glutaminase